METSTPSVLGLTSRCNVVNPDFICEQSSSVDQLDCHVIHIHSHTKTGITFKYRIHRHNTLSDPLESIHLRRNDCPLNRQRTLPSPP
jgi:hypothetical protein